MASPTFATESVLIIVVLDADEGSDVETFDIPGGYLHTETDEEVILLLEVSLNEIMVKVETNIYRKYVIISRNKKPLLYIQIQK